MEQIRPRLLLELSIQKDLVNDSFQLHKLLLNLVKYVLLHPLGRGHLLNQLLPMHHNLFELFHPVYRISV